MAKTVCRHWLNACDAVNDPAYLDAYRRDCVNLGKPVRIGGAEPYTATALDVEPDGSLTVQTDSGEKRRVFTGEVSVRGLYGYI